jgi:hypothetical protein
MSIVIRKATPDDVYGILDLGIEALNTNPYPGLVISNTKIFALAIECISSASHFIMIAEDEDKIVGCVAALVHPMMMYEKSQASVVQFYANSPGCGIKLLREFMKWVDSRPVIKMVCFTLEYRADPRIGKLLRRLGLDKELPVYMKLK